MISQPTRYLSIILAMMLASLTLYAQSPRMVLIEEATNASCGPCAVQNPYFEHYLALPHNQQDIIPLIYHANWPGRDVMNALAPTMHNYRVSNYYNITGVPTAVVNGEFQGAPVDTAALALEVNKARGTISPISIVIDEEPGSNGATVNVTVSSTETLENARLHIVVTEGYRYYGNAGSNGEKEFHYIARQMLPSHLGTSLSLGAGQSRTITESYTIDPEWEGDQLYIVAFVQSTASREVLQAATTRPRVDFSTDAYSLVQEDGEAGVWNTTLKTSRNAEYSLTVEKKMPEGWTAQVTFDGNVITDTEYTTAVSADNAPPMTVTINRSDEHPGKGVVAVTVTGPQGVRLTREFKLYSNGLNVLVFPRDEGRDGIVPAYEEGLAAGEYSYAVVDGGDEGLFAPEEHVYLYEVGKAALTRSDIETLREYLNNGGTRLFLIGAEIGYGLADTRNTSTSTPRDESFMQNYLHADYAADGDARNSSVEGIADDPIGDGLSFSIADGIRNQDTPDELTPRAGALPILRYNTGATAGIRYADGENRLVYLGFGAEGIGNDAKRTELLNRGITWLLGSDRTSGVTGQRVLQGITLGEPAPMPTTGPLAIPVTLDRPAHIALTLYDVTGKTAAHLADRLFEPGTTTLRFDASPLPNGLYILTLETGGATITRLITIAR